MREKTMATRLERRATSRLRCQMFLSCGISLPEGLRESDQLPEPIFTPTTKGEVGAHDEAMTYDDGYFYPGPAVKGVPLSMAPKESQDAINEFGRPEYEQWLKEFPHTQSLEAKAQVEMFRLWDQQVGAQKTK